MQDQSKATASFDQIISRQERSAFSAMLRSQEMWIALAVLLISLLVGLVAPNFLTQNNILNIATNFCFIAMIAIGMTPVIMTGGIDISVGSTLGLCGVSVALMLASGLPFPIGLLGAVCIGCGIGLVNGFLIAYLKLPSFIVTLGMMSILRSLTLVVTDNKVVYDFGPAGPALSAFGSGSILGIPNVLAAVIVLAIVMQWMLSMTKWGRYVRAIGGNEDAGRLTGLPVDAIKLSVYVILGGITGLAAVFLVGWLGAATNALGQGVELQVIAGAVIGGANLLGGFGTSAGAVIGSLLIEVIRNALLLAGVNPFWQGTFVGGFILVAILLERARNLKS